MTPTDYLTQREHYLAMAIEPGLDPGTTRRLRKLGANCLALASDPTAEILHQHYVANCRDFHEYVTKTGRYAPGAADAIDVQAKLAEIRSGVTP
jgi:hypothetical protein